MALLPCVEIDTPGAEHCVIWLHGLGADGHDFEPIAQQLALDKPVRFVFPHAPSMPVTLNNGAVMPAWYDIYAIGIDQPQDEAGIRHSQQAIVDLIENEQARGFASDHILLAGFSQGGAIALHTGLRYHKPLAGIMGLSTYLPLDKTLGNELHEANRHTPLMLAHGTQDPLVPLQFAELSRAILQQHGIKCEWHTYPMEHCVSPQEIDDIARWFNTVLV